MVEGKGRRSSTKQSFTKQNFKDESDEDILNPFDPVDTSDTDDESEVSEYGKKRRNKPTQKRKPKHRVTRAKPKPTRAPPAMSDIEYDQDSSSSEFGDSIEVRKPMSTPNKAMPRTGRLFVQTRPSEDTIAMSSGTPSVVQIHLNAGAAAGGTTINLDLADLVLGKRGFDEIGSTSLPTPAGSDAPDSPTRIVINNKTGQIRSAAAGRPSKRVRMLQDANERAHLCRKSRVGFCDIPFEIRVR